MGTLTPIDGGRGTLSAEHVLREGTRLFADHLTEGLAQIPRSDPLRDEIRDLACRYRLAAGLSPLPVGA